MMGDGIIFLLRLVLVLVILIPVLYISDCSYNTMRGGDFICDYPRTVMIKNRNIDCSRNGCKLNIEYNEDENGIMKIKTLHLPTLIVDYNIDFNQTDIEHFDLHR
ncbi:hypothetical protein [Desulfovibrio inopinatus]|uniref:hypothetical protein n=1 Tax=Desulfovibrio inopinatus TaxID=102109 RepID=UPI00048689A3|nr:hypothetical protein [Desulfovibrio inopinatus]